MSPGRHRGELASRCRNPERADAVGQNYLTDHPVPGWKLPGGRCVGISNVLIAATGLTVLAVLALTFHPVVEGDGVGYYAYLHAVLVSHSLGFSNEYSAALRAHVPVYLPLVTTKTSTGGFADFFPIGSAVLAAPAFLAALALRPSGEPQYGAPFVDAYSIASLLYGLVALAICYRLAVAVTGSRRAAIFGVSAAALATPYVFYLLSEPGYSHTFSAFSVSAFLYAWWSRPPKRSRGWFLLGLLGGLMAMTRFQDLLIMAIVLIDARRLRWQALFLVPGALIGFAPQLIVDQAQFGEWLPLRPPGQDLNPLHPHVFEVLFSSRDGLIVWTPAALFAAAGLFFIRDRRFQLAFVVAVVLETAVISSAPDTAGRSFGGRRFLDLLPFAAVGFAALAARIDWRIDLIGVVVICAWNLLLEANFEYVMGSSVAAGYSAIVAGQGAAVGYLPRLFAKGVVVRDLVQWRQSHARFDPVEGTMLLFLEAVCVAVGLTAARWRPSSRPAVNSETAADRG